MADEIVARYRLEAEAAAANARKLADANDKVTASGKQAQGSLDKMGQSAANMGRQLAGALGVTAGIAGVVMLLKSAGAAMIDFEYQMAKVKAVTSATDKEFKQLETDAKRLGASTKFTATEVGQLQEEYAKLGYTTPEILKATEATLLLATATGSTLAQAAEVAGSVIKQFGLDASETQRVADVMAASFNKSALGMEDFAEAMKYVGPLARAANVDVETTTALLGKLADAGLKGSIAGTSLSNLLTKLADANSDVSKAIGFNVNSSEDLFRALKALEGANIDLTAATELTDERSKKAFLTLLRGVDDAKKLSAELRNVEGATKDMADIMQDTSQGAIDNLKSALEGLALAVDQSGLIKKLAEIGTFVVQMTTGAVQGKSPIEVLMMALAMSADTARTEFEKLYETESKGSSILKINADIRTKQAQANEAYLAGNEELHASLESEVIAMEKVRDARLRAARSGGDEVAFLEQLTDVESEDSEVKKEQIRNIYFLTNAIKALNDERAKEGTTVERIKAINQELIPLQAELDALLGKQKDKVTQVNKAYEEWLDTLAKFEQGIKKMQDNNLELIDIDAERDKLIALRTIGGGTEEQQQALADRLNEIERDRLQKRIDMLKSFGRETIAEQVKMAEMEVSTANDIYAQMESDYQKFLEGQDADYEESIRFRIKKAEELAEAETRAREDAFAIASTLVNGWLDVVSKANEYEMISLENQLQAGQITREEYEKERRKLLRDQAENQKAAALMNAVVSTAAAVATALTAGPVSGQILAALTAALGAVQIGIIAAEPIPQFGKGGWVEGRKHSEGGTMIEAEKGEFIVSAAAAKRYAPILEQINKQTFQPPKDGWEGLAASISLNSQFTDRNLLVAIDRHREKESQLLMLIANRISQNRPKRGGYA